MTAALARAGTTRVSGGHVTGSVSTALTVIMVIRVAAVGVPLGVSISVSLFFVVTVPRVEDDDLGGGAALAQRRGIKATHIPRRGRHRMGLGRPLDYRQRRRRRMKRRRPGHVPVAG